MDVAIDFLEKTELNNLPLGKRINSKVRKVFANVMEAQAKDGERSEVSKSIKNIWIFRLILKEKNVLL